MVENITKRQVGLQTFSFKKRCSSRVFIAQCALAVDLALHRRLGGRRILHRVDLVQARPSYPSAALRRGGSPCPRHRAKNQEWNYLERQTGGFRYRLLWTFEKVILISPWPHRDQ